MSASPQGDQTQSASGRPPASATASEGLAEAVAGAGDAAAGKPYSEAQIAQALACPCLDDLKSGPCSERFVAALTCYMRNVHREPGTCCYPVFEVLHGCIQQNSEHFRETFVKQGQ